MSSAGRSAGGNPAAAAVPMEVFMSDRKVSPAGSCEARVASVSLFWVSYPSLVSSPVVRESSEVRACNRLRRAHPIPSEGKVRVLGSTWDADGNLLEEYELDASDGRSWGFVSRRNLLEEAIVLVARTFPGVAAGEVAERARSLVCPPPPHPRPLPTGARWWTNDMSSL